MSFDPNKVTYIARTDARGQHVQFGIKAKDRQRHVYIIGKTGMGKSTLLENMAVQDIQAGEGMAFIDPHGSAAETLLNYIPRHRINDVLYFAPFDTDHPVSFNIMEDVGPDKRHLVVSGLMSVFEKIWIDAWSARMAYILQNTLMALLEFPGSTLLGVNRMLSDKEYRKMVVDNVKDPGVRAFWVDEFAKYNERYMQEAGDAIKNKIGQFTANPIIRNIIGQPKSSFDIRTIMDERKILIINLSKGLIGESNANLLGSMLTTRIYLAAMSRADLPPEKMREMPNFYFYVDEFQSFANATFANILSEARKYHLNLTIAHQYIEQMEEEVRSAVFGNVGTIISFRVGPFDAEILETIFTPQFLATDIVNLSFAQVYLTLMIDGIGSQPFSAVTLPPIAPPSSTCKELVMEASRARFTRPRAEVEGEISKFHEPIVPVKKQVTEGGGDQRALSEKPREIVRKTVPGRTGDDARPREEGEVSPRNRTDTPQRRTDERSDRRREEERRSTPRSEDRRIGDERPRSAVQKNPAETIDNLRSVLKRIVLEPQQKIEEEREQEVKKVEEEHRQNLRVVLEQVIVPSQKTEEASSVAKSQNPPNPALSSAHRDEPKEHTARTSVSNRTFEKERTDTPVRTRVSPKELERMMRITTSDQPPL